MRTLPVRPWLAIAALILALSACGDDEETPAGPSDTTAPLVFSTDPASDVRAVPVGRQITVVFSEAMNPASAENNVTLSAGQITALNWTDDRTLVVDHTDWTQGTRISVTLATGFKDAAGNALASEYSFGFWTDSNELTFLASDPAGEAQEVSRNTLLRLLFSQDMDLLSITNATRVNSIENAKALIGYTVEGVVDDWIVLRFDDTLPAATDIEVTVSTVATNESQTQNLVSSVAFTFTTGTEADTTPPELLSIEPANGTVISASTPYLRMTFDEPIDAGHFAPSRIGEQFLRVFGAAGIEPSWTEGGRVVTVPLPAPLPQGLPILVEFSEYRDRVGNVQTTPIVYEVVVSGSADFFPMVDGAAYEFFESWTRGTSAGQTGAGSSEFWDRFEADTGSDFRRVRYRSEDFVESDGWDYLRRRSHQIELLGFHEIEQSTEVDVMFSPVVIYAKIPWMVQSWAATVQATAGESTFDLDYTIAVLEQENVPVYVPPGQMMTWMGKQPEAERVWVDAWKVLLIYDITVDQVPDTQGQETIWFAPTVGMVRSEAQEEEANGDWEESERDLVDILPLPAQ